MIGTMGALSYETVFNPKSLFVAMIEDFDGFIRITAAMTIP